ncbi:LacI family transcriptional regulator [Dyadobacter luteus]|jgi:LacI family transcriptional regulator|uniref:LacI family transcriptional regulator n=1 Tax=Dyadobacter luteus TaxID=2259619 RepID=A0A3D8Y7S5_9BACT|nr:LacI family DNA-binding transcriptional regulator [Dyadobacter luteus]REA59062.1 LacI family transcriptional regulator [Dyadobacter luteus]
MQPGKKNKKVSIRDIGRELGISITTVSFILNGKAKEKRISDALTERVLEFVERINFKPNMMAQGLRTGKSKIICLMVEDISNNLLFAKVARYIEEEAHSRGYRIIYCSTENKKEKATELIRLFQDRSIDGYIITPPEGIEEEIQSLINDGIPIVLIDRGLPGLSCNQVVIENLNSTYEAITHLISNGYKNIGFVTLDSNQTQMTDRLAGYQKALDQHHLSSFVKKLGFHQTTEQNVHEITSFLNTHPELDALFFSTNYIGGWGLQAIKNLNLRIPTDLAVVSFDDQDLFRFYSPTITAVEQPVQAISKEIIRLMLNALEDNDTNIHQITLPAKLIIRESSLPATVNDEHVFFK